MSSSRIQLDRLSEQEGRLRKYGYQQLEPFFVLREGQIKDERTGGVLTLDRARLQKIAVIQNNRIAQTGDFTPIIIGHTKKGKKENEQPELTGYASRYEVVPFYDTGSYGLRAVPWSKPHNIENFERFPRRSAELWTNPDLIDPISLLGANTPRLDLGLHRLQRDVEEVEYYIPSHGRTDIPIYLEMSMADQPASSSDKPADPPKGGNGDNGSGGGGNGGGGPLAAVFNSPEWKQMQQTISEMQEIVDVIKPMIQEAMGGGMGGQPGAVPPPGPAPVPGGTPPAGPGAVPPGPPQPEPGGLQQMSGHPTPPPRGMAPTQLNAGCPPGYGNSNMPAMMSRDGGQQYDPRDMKIAQLEQMLQTQNQQIAAMQLSMIESTVNGVLDDLEKKVTVDRTKDFGRLVQLSRADLDAEVQFMLATRKPVEQPTLPEAVQLQMQALGNQPGAMRVPMGPVQLTLAQAHDAMQTLPDPAMVAAAAGPASTYERLQDIVRNRGKLGNMEAYEQVMGRLQSEAQTNGKVRG